MNKNKLIVLGIVLIPLYLMLFSYSLVINTVSLSAGQEGWMNYFNGGSVVEGNYTTAERAHMEDVKGVINYAVMVEEIVFLILLMIVLWELKERNREGEEILIKMCYYGGIITVSLLGAVLLLMMWSFDFVFRVFHALFFPQGNWMFAYDSLLIQTFPLEFFIWIGVFIFGLALVLGLVLLFVGRYYYNNQKRSKKS